MKSKENLLLELFFNNPTKELHFEEILNETKIARTRLNIWLKKLIKNHLIKRIKLKGKMPYYFSNYSSSEYKNKKKIYALTKLNDSGLLNHLDSLKKANTIILFGSLSRSDWYHNSDIDIFIYGNPEGLKIVDYEIKLGRDIQLFICENKKELSKLGDGLMKNIVRGNIIKGNLDFLEVAINA